MSTMIIEAIRYRQKTANIHMEAKAKLRKQRRQRRIHNRDTERQREFFAGLEDGWRYGGDFKKS